MPPLRTWIIHQSLWPMSLPIDPPLGTVRARDREHAKAIARAQWPDVTVVIQEEGRVIVGTGKRLKKPRDYAQLARFKRGPK